MCPHLHLPAQSGSDRVLRRMRRGYDRAGYLRRIEALRRAVPAIELTTDIIVGFPGETEEDFAQTLTLLEEVGFGTVYGFTYSPRPGTEAAAFDDEPPADGEGRPTGQAPRPPARASDRREPRLDRADGPGPHRRPQPAGTRSSGPAGHPENRIVNFSAPALEPGMLASVRISEVSAYSLRGERLS